MTTSDAPVCQSCAMPMTKNAEFGTHADGSKHEEYCTYCFQKGEFTAPDSTIQDIVDFNANMMVKEFNMPEDQARTAAMEALTGLKRWR
jgi:hypothetical protein